MPELDVKTITHQHLLRSMDALIDQQEAVDRVVADLLRPMIDQDLPVVFYDLTTIRTERLSAQENDVRGFGMAKDGMSARQFMLGVVQTAEGLPIYHKVFDGNTAETKTLLPTLRTVLARFPSIKWLVLVADQGLLSLDDLEALDEPRRASRRALEFILAVPGRRYQEFAELLDEFHRRRCQTATTEVISEMKWNALLLIVAYDPARAALQTQRRDDQINAPIRQGEQWLGRLDEQDERVRRRGRKLSDSGAKASFYHAVSEAHLSKIIKVDLKSELFSYDIDESARSLANIMDGKLLLVTNTKDLAAQEIVISNAGSRCSTSPNWRSIRSITVCPSASAATRAIRFMALILYQVMRQRLKTVNAGLSPERALEYLRRIQHHQIRLDASEPVTGVSAISAEQSEVLNAQNVKNPGRPAAARAVVVERFKFDVSKIRYLCD
ncbi:transposase, IS4 family [Burkholderia sp. OK233]|nr:transposase, IS4 family [Burkholderia sp. OK233]